MPKWCVCVSSEFSTDASFAGGDGSDSSASSELSVWRVSAAVSLRSDGGRSVDCCIVCCTRESSAGERNEYEDELPMRSRIFEDDATGSPVLLLCDCACDVFISEFVLLIE